MSKEKNLYDILKTASSVNTISEIARRLFISEPYISKLLRQAENKYGVILIDRNQKPIKLTKAGEVFLKDLQTILESQNELTYDLEPFSKFKNYEIKIAFNQPWLETSAQGVIPFLVHEYPEFTFSFYDQTTNLAQENLLNRSIDLFVGKLLVNKNITSIHFTDSSLALLIPSNCSLFKLKETELTPNIFKKFNNQKYISLTDDSFFQAMIDHLFQENEVTLNKVVKVSNSLITRELAIQGMGYTIITQQSAQDIEKENEVKVITIPKNMLELSNGVSYLNSSSKIIKEVGNKLYEFLISNKNLIN
ncbi:LysR family transcriptional regulator [Lactobacillus sp. HT06-2]|uniref:LysR family transcriptional regulator n=1 Tax=Lactobacillus sp. HT06-2 TaxID=2080222 RepID=UPI000CD884F0|nr:LysR family transcriptional regulator [Lactobacillus sp. HT06-2]